MSFFGTPFIIHSGHSAWSFIMEGMTKVYVYTWVADDSGMMRRRYLHIGNGSTQPNNVLAVEDEHKWPMFLQDGYLMAVEAMTNTVYITTHEGRLATSKRDGIKPTIRNGRLLSPSLRIGHDGVVRVCEKGKGMEWFCEGIVGERMYLSEHANPMAMAELDACGHYGVLSFYGVCNPMHELQPCRCMVMIFHSETVPSRVLRSLKDGEDYKAFWNDSIKEHLVLVWTFPRNSSVIFPMFNVPVFESHLRIDERVCRLLFNEGALPTNGRFCTRGVTNGDVLSVVRHDQERGVSLHTVHDTKNGLSFAALSLLLFVDDTRRVTMAESDRIEAMVKALYDMGILVHVYNTPKCHVVLFDFDKEQETHISPTTIRDVIGDKSPRKHAVMATILSAMSHTTPYNNATSLGINMGHDPSATIEEWRSAYTSKDWSKEQ